MRANEFTAEDNDIAFLKLIIDRTWHTIKTDAQKKAEINASKEKIKKDDAKTKKLINKHRVSNRTEPVSAKDAGRPLQNNDTNIFRG